MPIAYQNVLPLRETSSANCRSIFWGAVIELYGARRSDVIAHVKLLDRPSACILWIFFDPDTQALGLFLWFGGAAGEKIPTLGEKIARHTKPNAMLKKADRPAHRVSP
jgi:hypothetical protein